MGVRGTIRLLYREVCQSLDRGVVFFVVGPERGNPLGIVDVLAQHDAKMRWKTRMTYQPSVVHVQYTSRVLLF